MQTKQSKLVPTKINWNFEIALTLIGLVLTLTATIFLLEDIGGILVEKINAGHIKGSLEQGVFLTIILFLIYGSTVYLISRFGFLVRDKRHKTEKVKDMLYLCADDAPSVTILVPSYKEELRVVHQTLLSAALQQYSNMKIVLLIDDPPFPDAIEDVVALKDARNLPKEIAAFLDNARNRYEKAKNEFLVRQKMGDTSIETEAKMLAEFYDNASLYLDKYADDYDVADHTDRFFVKKILRQPATTYRDFARSLEGKVNSNQSLPTVKELIEQYNRLIASFTAELSFFERKRHENLSHERNKAMNINAYIGLMGGSFREIKQSAQIFLEKCETGAGDFDITDSKYIITLDADSLLMPDYAMRLMHLMEGKGNEHLAVVQTPYSAIQGTENISERIAGATTDVQLLTHQGFTWANATYWVGANALLRKKALEDIKVIEKERGYEVTRYIQDRTVIEDTESSIDLTEAGWSLYNYPSRLAYSATPPDYGSLLIQRRRWANGGLIIMPKLIRHSVRHLSLTKMAECFVRLHYLISIATSSVGVLILLMYPFDDNIMRTVWLPLSAIPYFYLYGRDLNISGYSWADLPRVYALNLMLVPVHIGGVLKSIEQSITKEKIPFVRTPKVDNRTSAPLLYIVTTWFIVIYCFFAVVVDVLEYRWMHATFALINGLFLAYACTYFIGLREGYSDMTEELRLAYGNTKKKAFV